LRMRSAGLRAVSCNSRIGSVNAYLKWSGSPLRVTKLKQESNVPPTYSSPQVACLVKWKPKGFYQRRLHALVLTLMDTGTRLDEVLSLRVSDCDLDNLLLTVTGKGRKQRIIPFSLGLRRVLAKFILDGHMSPAQLLFSTKDGAKLSPRNMLRSAKTLCARLGFAPPARTLHATRHTFAVNYLRRGGSVFHLQKVLGHSTLEMTRRYANLVTADLSAVHERLSLLSP
jgi:integrase/recombinase XerD